MKVGGISWTNSFNSKKGVLDKFACTECGRNYKMKWAKDNHHKLCIEYFSCKVNN